MKMVRGSSPSLCGREGATLNDGSGKGQCTSGGDFGQRDTRCGRDNGRARNKSKESVMPLDLRDPAKRNNASVIQCNFRIFLLALRNVRLFPDDHSTSHHFLPLNILGSTADTFARNVSMQQSSLRETRPLRQYRTVPR